MLISLGYFCFAAKIIYSNEKKTKELQPDLKSFSEILEESICIFEYSNKIRNDDKISCV